jgi:hypothetical protein
VSVRRKWQTAFGLVWLAAVFGGRASPSEAAWQSADGQPTAIGKTAKSTADTDARVEAAYRKSDYKTLLQLLRESASQQSAFAERYRKVALQGSATVQGILGVIYEEGIGVSKDPVEAAQWFRKAAEQGDPAGQKYLGDMYRRGLGVPSDLTEAVKWYHKASEQGDGPAQGMLGMVYQKGLGVSPDVIQAYMWFTLAASNLAGTERDSTIQARDRVSAGMSKAAIEQAQQLARDWKPTGGSPESGVQTTAAAEAKAANPVNGTPQGLQSAQPAATPTPELSKGAQQLKLATLIVNLDGKIAFINFFLPRVTGAIYLGKEKITHENAKEVLDRFQRERRAVAEEIDREGFSNIGGDYDWHPGGAERMQGTQDECKLKELPSDASGLVTVVQNEHAVEFKGKALAGCGVVVGTVVVLKTGECGKVSGMRLVGGVWKDHSIKMMLKDTDSSVRCDAGVLTKRSAER